MIDIRLLQQFAAVADELSFTAAAQRLAVAQPWFSARIRKLEDQIGGPLFLRSTRRVVLTPLGERLHEQVQPLAEAAETAQVGVLALRAEVRRLLRIGCPILGEPDRRQADLLQAFTARSPQAIVEVEPGVPKVHAEMVRRGALDMFLALEAPEGEDWEALRLHRLALAMIMHETDPLATVATLTAPAFAGRRVATFQSRRAPALFDRLYGPMRDAGAQLQEKPELRRSLLRDEPDLIVSTFVPVPGDATLRHGLLRREVADAPRMWLHLFRLRKGRHSPTAEGFWCMAAGDL